LLQEKEVLQAESLDLRADIVGFGIILSSNEAARLLLEKENQDLRDENEAL
jgi:hypothetical protein